ncbi:nuclear transport factor 2 family protein [uncultured Jannaschia sp.]|uniref:YybH family protein n=1 Tax=uncultured Jannaschia sp. TaxID=293347 RepID=UPI00262E0862|nr:nuclear transport factor 2 family protein [uncultured Jannaschia sp.]
MSNPDEIASIRKVIDEMESAWNAGDFAGYMAGFANPDVIFVSEGRIRGDWQATLDHYIARYGDAPELRGRLSFHIRSIEFLAPDAAQLVSGFRLDRLEAPLEGINTRLMRKQQGLWVIALNHVSACPAIAQ